ncbi:nucleotidyltransferase [Oxalobacteraceae bacterium OTU3CAMAD1]|nr:nucleotidyltransferase [Oxalobacteraceae bacterium OTU3CAMAD1]
MLVPKLLGAAVVSLVLLALAERRSKPNRNLQIMFERFHAAIKLDENDERLKLRTKREILLRALKKKLAVHSLEFESFDQGSYAMRTGVVPKDGNYDIDVGLIFDCSLERFPNPVSLKTLVHDALAGSNRTVAIRRACVTVTYFRNGVQDYHVDLAVYLRQLDGHLILGKGRKYSEAEKCEWLPSAPTELTQFILSKFDGEEQAQYRRCIRYLKRWRDENFSAGAPLSIALTVAAALWFEPKRATDETFADLDAVLALVKTMQRKFGNNFDLGRLSVPLPGVKKIDLMSGLTSGQMSVFKERLDCLKDALSNCYGVDSAAEAARILRLQFGSEFPLGDVM